MTTLHAAHDALTPSPPSSDTLECRTSPIKMALLFIGCAALVAVCYWCTGIPTIKAQLAGWGGLVFFGAGLIIIPIQAVRQRGAVLTFSPTGVEDRRFGLGLVPWDEVVHVQVQSVRDQRFLCLYLRDEAPYLARMSWYKRMLATANRNMGFPLVSIGFIGLHGRIEDAERYAWRHVQACERR